MVLLALESPSGSLLNVYIVLPKPTFWMKSCISLWKCTNTYMNMHATCALVFMWFMMAVRILQHQSEVLSKIQIIQDFVLFKTLKNVLKEQKYKVKVMSFHCCRPAFLSMLMREAVMTNSPQTSCFTMNGALLLMPYVFSRPQSNSRETRRLRMTFRFNCCC